MTQKLMPRLDPAPDSRVRRVLTWGLGAESAESAADRRVRIGIALAFATAVISGVSIFVNAYAVKEFSSPTVFTTFKNTLVGLALLALVLPHGGRVIRERTRRTTPALVLGLVALGVVGGSVPFVLFFEGLARVGSGNAGFIQKTMFLWVALLALPFLGERPGRAQLAALALLFFAHYLLGGPGALRPDAGVLMVCAAVLLWSIEVVVAKRLLPAVASPNAATARMAIGGSLMLLYLGLTGRIDSLASLTAVQWMWGLGTAALLLGYVASWYAALERAPATAVTCTLTVGAPITAILNVVAGHPIPPTSQIAGYLLLLLAAGTLAALPTRGRGSRLDLTGAAAGGS